MTAHKLNFGLSTAIVTVFAEFRSGNAAPLRAVLPVANWRGGKIPTVKEMREERKRQALTEGRHFGGRTKMCLTG